METFDKFWSWCEMHWQLIALGAIIALLIIGPIE